MRFECATCREFARVVESQRDARSRSTFYRLELHGKELEFDVTDTSSDGVRVIELTVECPSHEAPH